jgi:hypothetical protein
VGVVTLQMNGVSVWAEIWVCALGKLGRGEMVLGVLSGVALLNTYCGGAA